VRHYLDDDEVAGARLSPAAADRSKNAFRNTRSGDNAMKYAPAFVLPLLSLFISLPAQASESLPAQAYELETGAIMICDTQKQVERLAQLFDGDLKVAVGAINTEEHNPNACGIADVAYVQGPEIGVARNGSHTFRIVPIVVVAAEAAAGYRATEPALFFTLIEVEEYTA
jgi:hypothetical protein